jgi:tetratricopeptide (TPR) repeat protein
MGKNARGTSAPIAREEASPQQPADSKTEPEGSLDVPVQSQALAKLSHRELSRYRRARTLLASGEGAVALLRRNIPLAGLGLLEAFLAQSWSVRFDSPDEMVRLAEVAVEVSRGLAGKVSSERLADLQARALGELANALRAADRLRSSQLAFGEAYACRQRGTGDPYLKARLFDLEASLLGTLREFPLALHRLSSLRSLYLELGESHLSGRAAITQALYTFYSGHAEPALSINEQGIALIDRKRDPRLFMGAVHNQLLFLVDLKLYPKATRILFDNRRNLIYKDRISALRLRGIEGRINYGLGNLVSAEKAFREVKEGLIEAGMSFYAALVALELAMVLKSLDRPEEALREVIVAREIFLSFEIYREYLGSVIFLEESFLREEATAELIEATVAQINRKWVQLGPGRMR